MKKSYFQDDIGEFISDFSFDRHQIEKYKKSKRLEIVFKIFMGFFGLISIYGTMGYILLFILNILIQTFEFRVDNYFMYIPSHYIVIVSLFMAWLLFIGGGLGSFHFLNISRESGITPTTYSLYRFSKSYQYFVEEEYDKTLTQISKFSERRTLVVRTLAPTLLLDISILLDYHHDKYLIPEEKHLYIDKYVNKATKNKNIDEEFVKNTFRDFFGILIEEISHRPDRREILLDIITTPPEEEYLEKPIRSEDISGVPSYSELLIGAFSELRPEIQPIWLVYITILALGLILVQISGTIAVIVVSVFLSALQIYERRIS